MQPFVVVVFNCIETFILLSRCAHQGAWILKAQFSFEIEALPMKRKHSDVDMN